MEFFVHITLSSNEGLGEPAQSEDLPEVHCSHTQHTDVNEDSEIFFRSLDMSQWVFNFVY